MGVLNLHNPPAALLTRGHGPQIREGTLDLCVLQPLLQDPPVQKAHLEVSWELDRGEARMPCGCWVSWELRRGEARLPCGCWGGLGAGQGRGQDTLRVLG